MAFDPAKKSSNNDPLLKLIEEYKICLKESQLKNELYKWRLIKTFSGRPNTSAPDFTEEINSIDFSNLIYRLALSVIRQIAKEKPEELRQAFIKLFDEKEDLTIRISTFSDETQKLHRDINPENQHTHHQDERTIATYLAYYNSLKYPLYKSSFYESFCKFIGIKPKKAGKKYTHYQSILTDFVNDYILEDIELLAMKAELLTEDCFNDSNHKIFAQDILYNMLDNPKGLTLSYSKIESKPREQLKMENELNQIFFGPPGTGKTYSTINRALEICGEDLTNLDRQTIKNLFEEKVSQGRIMFTTFHQSMTYEDFIESIKPIAPEKEGDPVIYRVEDGLFRRLCIEAAFSLAKEQTSKNTEIILNFSSAFDLFVQEIEDKLTSEQEIELVTKNGGKVIVDGISQQGSILIKHPGKNNIYPITKHRLSKLNTAFPDLSEIHNIDLQFRTIIGGSNATANWAVLNAINNFSSNSDSLTKNTNDYSWEEKKDVVLTLKKEDYKNKNGEPYVLIIDEINRGNISQIFGELITLIEEDKRLGNTEAIQVQLPYSKESFGIPPNLYIIGTMNTADRSVEALDTALRRRFSFTEILPDYNLIKTVGKAQGGLIDTIDLAELLQTINKRIERLLDKDHMIGHSYFLGIDTLDELKSVFQNKITPLLQEYFYGDYGKIGLVLGSGFFDADDSQYNEDIFAPFNDYDSGMFMDKKVYHLLDVTKMKNDEFTTAVNTLLRKE